MEFKNSRLIFRKNFSQPKFNTPYIPVQLKQIFLLKLQKEEIKVYEKIMIVLLFKYNKFGPWAAHIRWPHLKFLNKEFSIPQFDGKNRNWHLATLIHRLAATTEENQQVLGILFEF